VSYANIINKFENSMIEKRLIDAIGITEI
jgi:hypothetical protein